MNFKANISQSEFLSQYQENQPLHMKGAVLPINFSWNDVNRLIERSDPSSSDFKLSLDRILPKEKYVEKYLDIGTIRQRIIKPALYDYLSRGATPIINKIKSDPKITEITQQIGLFTERQIVSSAYLAFGKKSSFRCHWDTRDVFAIQLIGSKRWVVYEPSFELPLYTQQSKDLEHIYPCPTNPYMDIILEPGDVFYLPKGWWHNPLPIGQPSFHLALGTFPALGIDYLQWTLSHMENFLGARKSLSKWASDQENLANIANHIHRLINNHEHYLNFMKNHLIGTRIDSPLAVEAFCRADTETIPLHSQLCLCTNNKFGIEQNYLICNGTKLNIDPHSMPIINHIAATPGTSLEDLIHNFPQHESTDIKNLITALCKEDILSITL